MPNPVKIAFERQLAGRRLCEILPMRRVPDSIKQTARYRRIMASIGEERGVSEEKLAEALNVDIKRIKTKNTLLGGLCPEVADMLKDKSVDTEVLALLRKMKPMRQIEAVELMAAMNYFAARYTDVLLAAIRREDLAQPGRPKKIRGLTAEQMARMEREMNGIQREFKAVSASSVGYPAAYSMLTIEGSQSQCKRRGPEGPLSLL
jgi:RepB plasmid partitioning protein